MGNCCQNTLAVIDDQATMEKTYEPIIIDNKSYNSDEEINKNTII